MQPGWAHNFSHQANLVSIWAFVREPLTLFPVDEERRNNFEDGARRLPRRQKNGRMTEGRKRLFLQVLRGLSEEETLERAENCVRVKCE